MDLRGRSAAFSPIERMCNDGDGKPAQQLHAMRGAIAAQRPMLKSNEYRLTSAGAAPLVTALLLTSVVACDESGDTITLTLGHSLDTGHTVHQAMELLGERLAMYSGGQMQVRIYANGQLGSERETIELLQIGSLAMTKVSASPLEGFVPAMQVFSLPYIFADRNHYFRVLDSEIGEQLLKSLRIARLHGLGFYDAGSRSFYTRDHPVNMPVDLHGLKIRVMKSRTAVEMIAALGGSPTPISFGEVYTALQQGVVDGAENNAPSFFRTRHYEAAKFYSLDEHTSVPDVLIMSERVWQGLDARQRQWLMRAVQDSVRYQREIWQQDTERSLKALAREGVTIIRPDKAPFREAVAIMKASYEGTETGNMLKAIADLERPQ